MTCKLRTIAKAGAFAAILWLGPLPAHGQVSFRGAGYYGGGTYLGGGYSFERFSVYSWGNPLNSSGYNYGMPYRFGYGYGVPYGYGYGLPYGFEPSPIPYPTFTPALYPFFTYVTSAQNSPTPKTIEPARSTRYPSENIPTRSGPVDDSRSELVPSTRPRETGVPRRLIVYRADSPRQDEARRPPQMQTGQLIVTRSTAP
ncbi:hypothetical protein V5E97_08255 [Singulisphaera sp. Ch08]|uniref:Uncharacterized protein n=1 Tax=Singulisphaera sp. Ch08 TaxID=3120278 RepID=A0AAU7CLL0_9BACT